MSPKRVENTKTIADLSSQKDEFPEYDEAAILELSSLLGINTETLLLYLVISHNYDLEEGVFASRLRARLHGIKSRQLVHESKEHILHNGLYFLASEAWNYVMSKCSLEDNHLDILDWDIIYMQDLIRYRLFPENVFGKFPYQESLENSWFRPSKEQGDDIEVNVLNRTKEKEEQNEPYPLFDGKVFPQGLEEEGHTLFYHGTIHDSAKHILENGIYLKGGKANRDFSHKNGFYLNNKFQETRAWAFHIKDKNRAAILIFKIPNEVLDNFRDASLNLFNDEREWRRITQDFRSGPSRSLKKEMRKISFIEGPMASIVGIRRGSARTRGPIEGSYQMCILSNALAEQFDLYLHSIVCFE